MQMPTVVSQARRGGPRDVSCPTTMTAALSPELAVAYVRELSADVQAVLVLDSHGAPLAGDGLRPPPWRNRARDRGPDPPPHTVAVVPPPSEAPTGPSALDAAAAGRGPRWWSRECVGGARRGAELALQSPE